MCGGAQAAWARDGWPAPGLLPPSPPGADLCTGGTAALGGLLHLGGKGSSIAALEGHFPPLLLQPLAAAGTRARTPALHPGQRSRGPADGIAPLHLVKVPDGVPPACGLWMGQTPRDSLRAHRGAGKRPGAAVGGGRSSSHMHSAWRRRRDGTRGDTDGQGGLPGRWCRAGERGCLGSVTPEFPFLRLALPDLRAPHFSKDVGPSVRGNRKELQRCPQSQASSSDRSPSK